MGRLREADPSLKKRGGHHKKKADTGNTSGRTGFDGSPNAPWYYLVFVALYQVSFRRRKTVSIFKQPVTLVHTTRSRDNKVILSSLFTFFFVWVFCWRSCSMSNIFSLLRISWSVGLLRLTKRSPLSFSGRRLSREFMQSFLCKWPIRLFPKRRLSSRVCLWQPECIPCCQSFRKRWDWLDSDVRMLLFFHVL